MAPLVESILNKGSIIDTRDTPDSNDNQVPIAGIVVGSVIGLILVICTIAYCLSKDNIIRRQGWFKRISETKRNKNNPQYLSAPGDEESLAKRASFASERESIMFSRSRASSLQFAVVEDVDSQRRSSSQVYVLRGGQYIPLQERDAERSSLMSREISQMSEVDISSSSTINNDQESHYSIPVVVSPPPDITPTNQQHENVSRVGSIDRSDAVSEVSVV